MIRPQKHNLIHNFFTWYIKFIIKKDFYAFSHSSLDQNRYKDKAILLISNHTSWWDGFLLFYLNKIYFKKNFHVMILEETAKKIWFMKYLGAFSVNKQSKTIVESLDFAGKLLDDKDNLVLIFPQGKLFSSHTNNLIFEKGLMHIIKCAKHQFECVFASILFDYFEHRKPSVNIYLKNWDFQEYSTLQLLKNEYSKHHEESKLMQSKKVI